MMLTAASSGSSGRRLRTSGDELDGRIVNDIRQTLDDALRERILILDGPMGTMIQRRGLDEADFRGPRFADHPQDLKGNNDLLVLTRPT